MKKRISLMMLVIIAAQYMMPVVASASEISNYLNEEKASDIASEPESEIDASEVETSETMQSETSSEDINEEEQADEASLDEVGSSSRETLDQPWSDFNINDYAHVDSVESYVDTNFSKIWYSGVVEYSSNWQYIDSVTEDLRGMGDSVVGEYFTLKNVNNTFDVKVTISAASTFANNGQEWVRVKRNRDTNEITIQGQGYNYVKYHVDTYYKDTTTAVNLSALTVHVFQDVDQQQYAGVMRDNNDIYFDNYFTGAQRADFEGFQLFTSSATANASGSGENYIAATYYEAENNGSYDFIIGQNYTGYDPNMDFDPDKGPAIPLDIRYVNPDVHVEKSVVSDSTPDGIVSNGDVITYQLDVTNDDLSLDALHMNVRDSLLENLPDGIVYNDDMVVSGSDYTGSLTDSSLVLDNVHGGSTVTITYSITVNDVPSDMSSLDNLVRIDGQEPSECEDTDPLCDETTLPVEGDTNISKAITSESGTEDGVAEYGEDITYELTVANNSASIANDIKVRDSLVEAITKGDYPYLTYNGISSVTPSSIDYSGDLSDSSLIIDELAGGETVSIVYSITIGEIPSDVTEIINLATDNGDDPSTIDNCEELIGDCSIVERPVDQQTEVEKSVVISSGNEYVEAGDDLEYTIKVSNSTLADAYLVNVKDSLLSDMPSYLTISEKPVVNPSDIDYLGDLTTTDGIIFDVIPAESDVTITYTIHVESVPSDITEVLNVVTDNGENPDGLCDSTTSNEDCDGTEVPVNPETTIDKAIIDESIEVDNLLQDDEIITYQLTVTNDNDATAKDVQVRDSLLENLPSYMTLVGDIVVAPDTIETSGDLTKETFEISEIPANSSVTITYQLQASTVPDNISEVANIATDNGDDPDIIDICDPTDEDCSAVVIPTNPNTVIEKSITSESMTDDGIAEVGEQLTYELAITNNDDSLTAKDVEVRDSLVEAINDGSIDYLTYNGIVSINPSSTVTTGSLEDGDFVIEQIEAGDTVTITYTVTVDELPEDISSIANIATDDGNDPVDPCSPSDEDCSQVIIPTNPETIIAKDVKDENGDGVASSGETLTFDIIVDNIATTEALDVIIRDSMLEDLPSYLTFNDDVTIAGNGFEPVTTGDLTEGNYTIESIPGKTEVKISYSVTINEIPDDEDNVLNLVTDDGSNPEECTEVNDDCSYTITPLDPETIIEKTVTDTSGDNILQPGEEFTYTISVENTHDSLAVTNVVVRDSMLENLSDYPYLELISIDISPADTATSGSILNKGMTIASIEPNSTVEISTTFVINKIPNDVSQLLNVATDNGEDPIDNCEGLEAEDCDQVIIPVEPETSIKKAITSEDGSEDGVLESGETVEYTLTITNSGSNIAYDVEVRDSLVEQIASGDIDWLTYNDDMTVNPESIDYDGDLTSGVTLSEVPAASSVTITYTITAGNVPDDVAEVVNIATDNGDNPEEIISCPPLSKDCDAAVIDTDGDTIIEKNLEEQYPDGYANSGEVLTYTIDVTNNTENDAYAVEVRDSMLENLPEYVNYDGTFTITDGYPYSGNLQTGLTIDMIPAGEVVSITYSVTLADTIPSDVEEVLNVVTDNGSDPKDPIDPEKPEVICPEGNEDCDEVVTPIQPEIETPIDPQQGDTIIEKSVSEEFEDGYASPKETLTYTIEVTNDTDFGATKVAVRDSMLENIPSYVTFNDDVKVAGSEFTGSLTDGNLVLTSVASGDTVTITYSITLADSIPSDVEEVLNVVTDNGSDPKDPIDPEKPEVICPEGNDDCDEVVTPIQPDIDVPIDPTEGNTVITKEVSEEFKDGYANPGEVLTYSIHVTNNTTVAADNVVVRDSMLENLPEYVTFNDDVTTDPSDANTTGSLTDGDFTIVEIASGDTVTITYSITLAESVPGDISELLNVATDNGDNPDGACDSTTSTEDCDGTELPIQPEIVDPIDPTEGNTVITKEVSEEFKDGYANPGEVLTYSIHVTNNTTVAADNVEVRDSMLENLPEYVTFNDDVTTDTSDANTTGSLTDGDFTIIEIASGDTVTITYSITLADSIPSDVEEVLNVVTDNGSDPKDPIDPEKPEVICPEGNDDCDEVVTPIQPDIDVPVDPTEGNTVIEKTVSEEFEDGYASPGETLTYTIEVTNNTNADANNVAVRDSMLENLPEYVTFNDDVTTDPSDANTTGTLTDGDFTIVEIASGDTVTITYSIILAESVPEDISELLNVATDNGENPDSCPIPMSTRSVINEDCADVVIPLQPEIVTPIDPTEGDTVVTKSVSESVADGYANASETLTYTIEVENNTEYGATSVPVRDSMLENIPSYITFNDDVLVDGSEFTGNLTDGNLVLTSIASGDVVIITYSVTLADSIPSEVEEVLNVVTDNGENPAGLCDSSTSTKDCDGTETPVEETEDTTEVTSEDKSEVENNEDTDDETNSISETGQKVIMIIGGLFVLLAIIVLLKRVLKD